MKINIGAGRIRKKDWVNIDCTQFIDGNGDQCVDVVMDIEKKSLPYPTASVDEICADNVLEHLEDLRFVLNECHRVLKDGGILSGIVPVAGSDEDYRDPTHKRRFVKATFDYFCGSNPAKPDRPSHPKYADYNFAPWDLVDLKQDGALIYFKMKPRKIDCPPYETRLL